MQKHPAAKATGNRKRTSKTDRQPTICHESNPNGTTTLQKHTKANRRDNERLELGKPSTIERILNRRNKRVDSKHLYEKRKPHTLPNHKHHTKNICLQRGLGGNVPQPKHKKKAKKSRDSSIPRAQETVIPMEFIKPQEQIGQKRIKRAAQLIRSDYQLTTPSKEERQRS